MTSMGSIALSPVYVCCGDEPLLVQESVDRIRSAAKEAGFNERIVLTAAASGFYWEQLLELANTGSFFSSKRVIELRIPNGKPGTEGAKVLARYCQNPPDDVLLLVVMGAVGWQERKASWFKTLTQIGQLIEQKPPDCQALPGWIQSRMKQQGIQAEPAAIQWMADHVEGNLLAAHQEIQKLAILYPEKRLSLTDIQSALSNAARYTTDQLSDALLRGDIQRYWQVLDGLKQEGEALPLLLWRLAEDCRTVSMVRSSMKHGQTQDAALKSARIFYERRTRCQRWLSKGLAVDTLIIRLAEIDRQIKGLLPGDPWEALRRLPFALRLF